MRGVTNKLNSFTLWLSDWMTESCEVVSGVITQLLGKYFHIVGRFKVGHGNSPPFSIKFCQYSILSKITISIYIAGKCPGVPPNPFSLSEFSWSSPAHNAICFSAFYKITVKCRILLNFYFGHTLGARGFFFQIVSTPYFILSILRVGLWSQGTLAKFGREKVKP